MVMEGGIGAFMWACCSVQPDGTVENARGCSVVREALGTYLITLDRSLTEFDGVFLFSLGDTGNVPVTPRFIEHNHVSPTQIRVWTMSVAVVLFDMDWHFGCWKVAP